MHLVGALACTAARAETAPREGLLELVADFVFETDAAGVISRIDACGAEHVLGHEPGALLGRSLPGLARAAEHRASGAASRDAPREPALRRVIETWCERADGSRCCLEIAALGTRDGGLRGIARDVTARRLQEEELRQSAQKLAMHVAQTPFAVIGFDRDFRITEWNPGAERIFGYTAEEARGRHPTEIILDCDSSLPVDEVWTALLAGARDQKSTNENRTKSGATIVCEWHNTPLVDASGEVIGVTSLCQDVTARVEQERALVAARSRAERANAMKTEFLARLSHELRTPLHGILSFAQLGRRRVGIASMARITGYFEQILASGRRLEVLLADLLDVAKLEVGRLTLCFAPHDFRAIVEACLAEQRPALDAQRLRVRSAWPGQPLPLVTCDRVRLGQVVINLLGNALRYTPEGGRIDIRVTPCELDAVADASRPGLRFELSDSGCGLAEDELEHIFGSFARGRDSVDVPGGSGLGLAIARELISLHGGTIDARNNAQGGATFGFVIPFDPPRESDAPDC
ncbi:MAG: PAS domain-containing sensor histidine kinase [Gammaproteobacteria bacterium]